MFAETNSLYELFEAFPDEQSCLDHLAAIRWANGKFCPHCGSLEHAHQRKGCTQGGAGRLVVLGILERNGELRAAHVPSGKGLGSEVISNIADDAQS